MSLVDKYPKKLKKSSQEIIFKILRQVAYTKLFKKYSSGKFSFSKISINHLLCTDNCQIVARFKEFLIIDDNTEFIRRFYQRKESFPRLKKILIFYETYSKIFPNYLVLKENKYLYRNIRKKQKMINAINEIKREEKENKKKLGIKNEKNELFTKKIKDEIKYFQKKLTGKLYKNSFDRDNQNDEDTLLINPNSISISILNWKEFEKENFGKLKEKDNIDNINIDSFITNKTEESISKILSILNDNKIYIKDLPNIFKENKIINVYSNKKKQNNKINKITNNNLNKKAKMTTNIINKYGKNSANATTSSTIASKRIQKKEIFSAINKVKDDDNKKNNIKINIRNKDIQKKLMLKTNTINNINNNKKSTIYQQMSPQIKVLKFKKHFFNSNNNIKNSKTHSNKNKEKKINKKLPYNTNTEKKEVQTFSNNFENIKKHYLKNNPESQNLDTQIRTKNNSKKIITENNNNLINNIFDKGKKAEKEKVSGNLRDIIKNNKNNKICLTAKKEQNKEGFKLNTSKKNTNSNLMKKSLKLYDYKSQENIKTLSNLNCNKNKFNFFRNEIENSIATQKTEFKDKKLNIGKSKQNTKVVLKKDKKELTKIKESKSLSPFNSKIENLKKKAKILDKQKNNILIISNDAINSLENNYTEKFNTTCGNKITNIKYLIQLKNKKIKIKSNKLDSNSNTINNKNKRVKTISNEDRNNKNKNTLNNKKKDKSSGNSYKNLNVIKRIQTTKIYLKKTPNDFNNDILIKTPDVNKKKLDLFKKSKSTNIKKLHNLKKEKEKEYPKGKVISTYTIKVNKAFIKRKMNKIFLKEKTENFLRNNKSEIKRDKKIL